MEIKEKTIVGIGEYTFTKWQCGKFCLSLYLILKYAILRLWVLSAT